MANAETVGAAEIHKMTAVVISDTYTMPAHNKFHAWIAHAWIAYLGVKILTSQYLRKVCFHTQYLAWLILLIIIC